MSTSYSYDLNDRLTSQGGTTYSYDNNGNTLTESIDNKVKTYSYDAKNKLIGVSTTESDVEVSSSAYSYNINGIRDSKTEDGVTTSYVVDSNRDYAQVLEEIVDGLSTVTYSYGHDLVSQNRNGEFRFYQYDGLGSTRGLSNSAGVITDSYDYEAFGDVLNETGTTDNNYKFTGEQFDSSLDQYYLRARYYDQGVGRFTQQDTYMGNNHDPVSLHKYLYAGNDPVLMIDPSGYMYTTGELGAGLRISSKLTNAAISVGRSAISRVFVGGGGAAAAGGMKLAQLAGKSYFKKLLKKCKSGKSDICQFAKGYLQAYTKMELLARSTPNSRLKRGANNRILVVIGAFDVKKGVGVAATNGDHRGASGKLQSHARKFGLGIGQKGACGTNNTVGRCAEWRAVDKLRGTKVKDIRWTSPHYVDPGSGGHGFGKLGKSLDACAICQTVGFGM